MNIHGWNRLWVVGEKLPWVPAMLYGAFVCIWVWLKMIYLSSGLYGVFVCWGQGLSPVLSLYGSVGSSCGFIALCFGHYSYDQVAFGWLYLRHGVADLFQLL